MCHYFINNFTLWLMLGILAQVVYQNTPRSMNFCNSSIIFRQFEWYIQYDNTSIPPYRCAIDVKIRATVKNSQISAVARVGNILMVFSFLNIVSIFLYQIKIQTMTSLNEYKTINKSQLFVFVISFKYAFSIFLFRILKLSARG